MPYPGSPRSSLMCLARTMVLQCPGQATNALLGLLPWTVGSSIVTNDSASYFVLAMQGFSDVSHEVWFGTELIANYTTKTMVFVLCSWHLVSGAPYTAAVVAASSESSIYSTAVDDVAISATFFGNTTVESVWSGPGLSFMVDDGEVLLLQLNASAPVSTSALRTSLVTHQSSVVWQQTHLADETVHSMYFSHIRNNDLYEMVIVGVGVNREDSYRFDVRVLDRGTGSSTTLLRAIEHLQEAMQCSPCGRNK